MLTVRLTTAQAVVKFLQNQYLENGGQEMRFFAGTWAIFGHGNVTGLGEALASVQADFPTYRGNNEQSMAHAAIAFAKTNKRQRAMVCTSSIGPGATNMVTAAALAHVNRLPVLFLPGDIFANRAPDPVLQQVEDFEDGTVSANDCFRPVSRYFDRILRPEQIITALPRAVAVLTDPAQCGPVTLSIAQDTQAEAYDFPAHLFEKRVWGQRRQPADTRELGTLMEAICRAEKPLLIAGGGVLYSGAEHALTALANATGIPVAETQAGKSALPWDHPLNLGSIGVTGTSAANIAAQEADLIVAVGTRLQDFTTGSWSLFQNPALTIAQVNVAPYDAHKHSALPVVGDARTVLEALNSKLDYTAPMNWQSCNTANKSDWLEAADKALNYRTTETETGLPSDADVIGVLSEHAAEDAIVVCAAGGLPGELHKLWRPSVPGGYHLEYGFSCMGYEIAGGLGAKLAAPERDVYVMVGDGSYLMMNSELATAAWMGIDLTVILLDNRGYGCINRLQQSKGADGFNNLLQDSLHETLPDIDFRAHAESMGAYAQKVAGAPQLADALAATSNMPGVKVFVIDTDPYKTTEEGGNWWDVPVAEVSENPAIEAAHKEYLAAKRQQR